MHQYHATLLQKFLLDSITILQNIKSTIQYTTIQHTYAHIAHCAVLHYTALQCSVVKYTQDRVQCMYVRIKPTTAYSMHA